MDNKKKLNIKAVVIGWLVDTAGSFIVGIFIGVVAGIILASKGLTPEQIVEELSNSIVFQNISLFTGFSFTFIGGYIAAYIAKADELKHALIVGILSLITSLLFIPTISAEEPIWLLISLFVIPFALLGGYLRKITKKDAKPARPTS